MFETVAEDFAADPPEVVVIDRISGIPWWCGREFNILEYFKRQPLFANTWLRYEYFAATNRLDLYRRVGGQTLRHDQKAEGPALPERRSWLGGQSSEP